MFYTIKHATSYRNPSMCVDLNKDGNKYIVAAWDRSTFRTVQRVECERCEEAEAAFDAMCKQYDMTNTIEPEQDWDPCDFD